jgi:vacuolar-type H+-ATPase subunit H
MAKAPESSEQKVVEQEAIIQEYVQNVSKALAQERGKLREEAEKEASQIIAKARIEANKVITQARQEAKIESGKYLVKMQEKGKQIIKESCEKASTEAQQESATIINKTREKTAQIINEAIENGITQLKSEFARVASEARNRLDSETSKLFKLIIDETQNNIQAGIDHLANAIDVIDKKLVNEIPDGKIMMSSSQVDEKVVEIKFIDKLEHQEADKSTSLADEDTNDDNTKKTANTSIHKEKENHFAQISEISTILLENNLDTIIEHTNEMNNEQRGKYSGEIVYTIKDRNDIPIKLNRMELIERFTRNVNKALEVHGVSFFYDCYASHLEASVGKEMQKAGGFWPEVEKNPYKVIKTIIEILDRKEIKGTCPECNT